MATYRKKPVEVEAWKVLDVVERAMGKSREELPEPVAAAIADGVIEIYPEGRFLVVKTLEGEMVGGEYDMLIQEPFPVDGRKFYPCKSDIFEETYESVEIHTHANVVITRTDRTNAIHAIKAIRHYTRSTLLYAKGIYDAGYGEIEHLNIDSARALAGELEVLGWSAHLEFR